MKNVTSYIERVASLLVCIYTSISILQSKIYDYQCDNHHSFKFHPAFCTPDHEVFTLLFTVQLSGVVVPGNMGILLKG